MDGDLTRTEVLRDVVKDKLGIGPGMKSLEVSVESELGWDPFYSKMATGNEMMEALLVQARLQAWCR